MLNIQNKHWRDELEKKLSAQDDVKEMAIKGHVRELATYHVAIVELLRIILKLDSLCMSSCSSADLYIMTAISTHMLRPLCIMTYNRCRRFETERAAMRACKVSLMAVRTHLTIIWVLRFTTAVADFTTQKALLEVLVEVVLDSPEAALLGDKDDITAGCLLTMIPS